jgi:hypothetical protein
VIARVLKSTVLGLICVWSIVRCAGEVMLAIGIEAPEEAQPFVAGGGVFTAAVMTAVGTDDVELLPSAFFACTLNRIVFPTSTPFNTYVRAFAPLMFAQLPPVESQRTQKSL